MTREGPPDEILDEQLSAFLDGELDAAAEVELRAVLASSPELAARLERLRSVDQRLRALPAPPLAPRLARELRARIEVEARRERAPAGRRTPGRRARWLGAALAAAAAAAVLALALLPRLRPTPGATERAIARTPERPVAPEAPLAPEAPPPAEALALVMEIESETDLEVIEMLDLLETLGEIESS